ncbi:MAG: hypothetical protein Q9164_000958 [Protoblastenia rupestris]
MADDTRQSNPPGSSNKIQSYGVPVPQVTPENANVLPGGSSNTAGGKAKEASIFDALRSVSLEDFKGVHKKPCVRDALMTGMGAGFGIGGVRSILGATILSACNWTVGTFCFGSFLMYEYCQRKRYLEMQGMKRAVEVMDRKQTEKQLQVESSKAARRKAKEEN